MLADDGHKPGGRLLADARRIDDRPAAAWIDAVVAELRQAPTVRVLADATVWGHLEHNMLAKLRRYLDHMQYSQLRIRLLGQRERVLQRHQ